MTEIANDGYLRVVAGVVRGTDGRVLLTRRLGNATRGGMWEFPGGAVEQGEADSEALMRELREELALEVTVERQLGSVRHRYPDLAVALWVYLCRPDPQPAAGPQALEVAAWEWVSPTALAKYSLCAADRRALEFVIDAVAQGVDAG